MSFLIPSNSASTEPIKGYEEGQQIELQTDQPNIMTTSLGSTTFTIEIVKRLATGSRRHNEVSVVRILHESGAESKSFEFVAKFFDHRFSPHVDPREWPKGSQQRSAAYKDAEVRAYKLLKPLQGIDIPIFYGEYTFQLPCYEGILYNRGSVILLEFINTSTLYDIRRLNLTFDKLALKLQAFAILNNIHSHGVYHHDLVPENLFWDNSKPKLVDFEQATFRNEDTKDLIEEWIALDRGQLISALRYYGIKDERPGIPESFIGWL